MAKQRALHVIEPFTLHEYEKVADQPRPRIKQTTYDRGEMVTDAAEIDRLEKSRDEGTVGHNSFVAVMLDKEDEEAPEGEKLPEEQSAALPHPDPEGPAKIETDEPAPAPEHAE